MTVTVTAVQSLTRKRLKIRLDYDIELVLYQNELKKLLPEIRVADIKEGL